MTNTVYITGAAGLVGSELVRLFCFNNWKVKGCDTFIGGLESNLDLFRKKNVIDFKEIDILDYKSLRDHIGNSDIVFHCAALPYEGLSVFSPKIVTENIVGGTVSVASACLANGVKTLVNFSSMARYGAQNPPFTEDLPRSPEDPYGLAKAQAEEHLELLNKLHGLSYFTVVPHNVVGVGQRYMDPYRNVVAIMINRTLLKKPIIIYGDGEQKRSFSNIRDCGDAIWNLVNSDRDLTGEVFNIGPDDNEITIKDLAYRVGHHCGIYPKIEYFPDRPAEVKNAWCSSEKIKTQFNYNTTRNIDDTIIEMVNWISDRGAEEFNYALDLEFITESTPKTWVERLM
jgi:UDP-glucose 4-epimerase